MCNLSKGIEDKGIQKGIQQGKAEGKILGAIQVYRSLNTPEEETLKRIMSLFSLTEEEARSYMAEVESE